MLGLFVFFCSFFAMLFHLFVKRSSPVFTCQTQWHTVLYLVNIVVRKMSLLTVHALHYLPDDGKRYIVVLQGMPCCRGN